MQNQRRLGPYSRKLQRGAIGTLFDGRSAEGRFVRHLEAELIRHVGGNPSITERRTIVQLIRLELQIEAFDQKLASNNWTPHDQRTYNALLNAHRHAMLDLGLKSEASKPPSLSEVLAQDTRRARENGAGAQTRTAAATAT